jgi:hypothetical protein
VIETEERETLYEFIENWDGGSSDDGARDLDEE